MYSLNYSKYTCEYLKHTCSLEVLIDSCVLFPVVGFLTVDMVEIIEAFLTFYCFFFFPLGRRIVFMGSTKVINDC